MTTTPAEDPRAVLSATAAARVRGLRAELRLSQAELAIRAGLSRSGLSDRESGVKAVNLDELPALAAALDTTIEYLLGLSEARRAPSIDGALGSVRHEGLEPPTRWFAAPERALTPVAQPLATVLPFRPRARLLGGVSPTQRPAGPPAPAAAPAGSVTGLGGPVTDLEGRSA